jgi:hypothetical protein
MGRVCLLNFEDFIGGKIVSDEIDPWTNEQFRRIVSWL